MKGYKFLADTLKGYEVSHIFYIESMMENMVCELKKQNVRCIMAHSENAAGYMADGYARASGKPGICMAQSIGTANLAGGLYDASLSNSPVIAITGKKSPALQYTGAYQEGEHRLLFEGITKFNADITDTDQIPHVFRQLFRAAVSNKPGPVHTDIIDNCGVAAEYAEIQRPVLIDKDYDKYPPHRPAAEPEKIKEAALAIANAQKPLLIVGKGAIVSGAHKELYAFATKTDIPIVTTPDGKTIIDETDPLWSGVIGGYGMACANVTASHSDLVVLVGTQASDQTTNGWNMPPRDVLAIQIDVDATELGRNYPHTIGLCGDAKVVLTQLLDVVDTQKRKEWRKEVKERTDTLLEEYKKCQDESTTTITPYKLCMEVTKALPDDTVLISDTGNSAIWTSTMVRMLHSQKYIRAAGSLGWSIPGSIGAKCALPEKPVICFCGDGGFYYHLSELETAVRYGINTVTIINNNGGLVQVRELLDFVYQGEPENNKEECYRFTGVNLSKLAETMGCWATRIEKAEEIVPAIKQALKAGKPAVIEVITDDTYPPNPMPKGPRPLYGFAKAWAK